MLDKQTRRQRRHKRIRTEIKGTAKIPRLCVFRSSNHIYAQIINDDSNKTIISATDTDKEIPKKAKSSTKIKEKKYAGKEEKAYGVGKIIAQKAIDKKIEKVVFDRGGYKYHGRVKALAEGARDSGLKF